MAADHWRFISHSTNFRFFFIIYHFILINRSCSPNPTKSNRNRIPHQSFSWNQLVGWWMWKWKLKETHEIWKNHQPLCQIVVSKLNLNRTIGSLFRPSQPINQIRLPKHREMLKTNCSIGIFLQIWLKIKNFGQILTFFMGKSRFLECCIYSIFKLQLLADPLIDPGENSFAT